MLRRATFQACIVALAAAAAPAQDWPSVAFVEHATYQAVHTDGSSAYGGAFPIRLIGVVLNDTEDWLDPAADYDSGVHMWEMGGEAEFYLQAVDLDGTAWDTDPGADFADAGGAACWMGQNYGNHSMHGDPSFNYTDAEWRAELDRLGLWRPGTPLASSELVRAGDLVEVRARGGLPYKGKMNVNEQHDNDPALDFEIVVLQKGHGLPEATAVTLSDLKDAADAFLFDDELPTREFGGELHQSTRVMLTGVRFTDVTGWGADGDFTVTDDLGRTLTVHLGLSDSFAATATPGVNCAYDLVGILDQADFAGTGGYRLLVMDGGDVYLPGDATRDGDVDVYDLAALANHYGTGAGKTWEQGDFDHDGEVDVYDLAILANRYGAGGAGGEAVPAPSLSVLLAAGAAALLRRRRRR